MKNINYGTKDQCLDMKDLKKAGSGSFIKLELNISGLRKGLQNMN